MNIQINTTIITLAIESSCDDTSCAILENNKVLANLIANQDIHRVYGGVVPELASRAHQKNIVPVVDAALKKANKTLNDINLISFTKGPGLLGSLIVGTNFAKGLALALNKPLIEVNHMQGHYLAHFIDDNRNMGIPPFPFICLTVSGGHTQLVMVKNHFDVTILGETLDDAAGEAFDKVAKILNLPYPGGPLVDKYAKLGNENAFKFNKPQILDYNFSFSGFKTSFLNFIKKESNDNINFIEENLNDLCASAQKLIVEVLLKKLESCANKYQIKHLAIAGGVSANSKLRNDFLNLNNKGYTCYIPDFEYCTDNAAMIGITGYLKYINGERGNLHTIPSARLKVNE